MQYTACQEGIITGAMQYDAFLRFRLYDFLSQSDQQVTGREVNIFQTVVLSQLLRSVEENEIADTYLSANSHSSGRNETEADRRVHRSRE